MEYPKKLTADEWNLLVDLTTYNHMDCWFELRDASVEDSGFECDYVRDTEEEVDMNLHDAIEQVAEGLFYEDLVRFKNGYWIWNGLMEKFGLDEYKSDEKGQPKWASA